MIQNEDKYQGAEKDENKVMQLYLSLSFLFCPRPLSLFLSLSSSQVHNL